PDPDSARLQSDLIFSGDRSVNRLFASQYRWDEREEGLAILTRYPVVSSESMILPEAENDGQRRVLIAVLDIDGQRVLAANTHLAFRIDQDISRLEQSRHLVKALKTASEFYETQSIILAGDFNAVPQSQAIIEITEGNLHLVDIFADSEERINQFTSCSKNTYVNSDDHADRWIDYIFISTSLRTRSRSLTLNGKNGAPYASDHIALEADVEIYEK
ncbi:MAG: endonuclease/exonuclease/phosphatase family protein, partial [Pseudomonadales bacterium]